MKILSFNTSTATSLEKMAALHQLLREADADVVLLQEVRTPVIACPGYEEVVNIGTESRGTALLHRASLQPANVKLLPCGRGLSAVFGGVTVVNVYGPAGSQGRGERPDFLLNKLALLLAEAAGRVVIAGDWNCIARAEDTTGSAEPCRVLQNVLQDLRLVDAWRQLRPGDAGHTYRGPTCTSRLDRVYVTEDLKGELRGAQLHTAAFGDHRAVSVDIALDTAARRAPRRRDQQQWKFDPIVLTDPSFLPALAVQWERWRKDGDGEDIVDWWEGTKSKLKAFCIRWTRQAKQDDNKMLLFLSGCLNAVSERLYGGAQDKDELQQRAEELRTRMLAILSRRLDATRARAKVQDEVDGEAVGLHHVAACLRRGARRNIEQLQDGEGHVLRGDAIAEHVRAHFQAVFSAPVELATQRAPDGLPTPPAPASRTPLLDAVVAEPVLTAADSEAILRPFTLEELEAAVVASPRGKSPGEDGLTSEFFVAVWTIVGKDFLKLANAMLQRRRVAPSFKRGVMVLIPKTAQAPVTVKDLRPLTLLNVDGKVFSRALARRLEEAQRRILHPMQVQAGSTRTLQGALCDVRDAVAIAEHHKEALCVVALDIAGAFNNLQHHYLWAVLRQHGVSEEVVELLQSMYDGATTRISVNGVLTDVIQLLRGIRQGCPVSMLLYCLASAPLIKALDSRLAGVRVEESEGRLAASAYVDDTVALLRDPEEVPVLVRTLAEFGAESGLLVNAAKSAALPVGRWPRRAEMPFPVVEAVKLLGVTFTARTSRLATVNWPGRVGVVRARLVDARLRSLNLVQKVQYINTYVMPLLWHLAQVAPLLAIHAQTVRKAIGRFLWAAKRVRVPFNVLVQPTGRGGLGLQDPVRKAAAMFTARWETAARADGASLSGCWLRRLQQGLADVDALPACLKYFGASRRSAPLDAVPPDLLGKGLTRTLYAAALAEDVPVPRAMREVDADVQQHIWRCVHAKHLPVDARSTWYEAVHDVLPTAIRLQAAKQAAAPDCPRCQEPEDVEHRLARCGAERQAAWAWLRQRVLEDTGVAITERTITRPTLPAGPPGATATWTLGVAVHFLATRRNVTAAALRRHLEHRQNR